MDNGEGEKDTMELWHNNSSFIVQTYILCPKNDSQGNTHIYYEVTRSKVKVTEIF